MASTKTKTLIGGHIELGHVLGSGGFGKVYSGYDVKTKQQVAVKMIDKQLVKNNGILEYVEREIEMMRKIKSPHVVRLLEAIETSKAYTLVMELAANGELFDKIVDSERFDEKTARNYFQQLISAVHYCHGKNIVHRDLKAENLLLGENNTLKVCDFGLSRYTKEKGKGQRFNDNEVLFTSLAGSIDYQAPEVLKEQGYEGSACDMWSCGCILFFMLCGYLPFTDRSDGLTRKRILSNQYNRRNKYLTPEAADLIEKLLNRDPRKRYTTKDVLNHPWFQVDLDPSLFPNDATVSPASPSVSGEFIQRAITPQEAANKQAQEDVSIQEQLHKAFQSCNVAGDGFLNKEEIRDTLIKLNGDKPIAEKEIQDFMSFFTLDKEGRISEEEFIIGWTKHQNSIGKKYDLHAMTNLFHYDLEKEFLMQLRGAFDSIDTDHSGIVTEEKLKSLDLGMTDADIKSFFSIVDPEGKSKALAVTFEQFVSICMQYELLKNNPIAIRLRRLENFYDITEHRAVKGFMTTGYTVCGNRDMIRAKLMMKQQELSTTFEPGDVAGFLYGTYTVEGKKMLEVGVRLTPSVQGYTKVAAYRIRGRTTDFREWFITLRKALKDEVLKYEEDTAVKGDVELM
ncbi:protein kinase [Angomonas deanei]|uniref:Protein tyrosine kinase/Protein kinase domain/RIO1 family/Kinase-like/EF-hand domain pair, putative n=1 Tax=Angomonas deanei TaxID=59799 RepID=A0A7G2CG32_9TRYP|nr:protein kinase [Angomonas deanei]CAD2217663.1 Protein tyrosine kinase/Protein kinase domain/RIO1 family/Kinase-like/EF-hand domain pair, putative [Angomonas deanei]|eukprot:EPY26434.1 protein kinase [Angomonas deanei]